MTPERQPWRLVAQDEAVWPYRFVVPRQLAVPCLIEMNVSQDRAAELRPDEARALVDCRAREVGIREVGRYQTHA